MPLLLKQRIAVTQNLGFQAPRSGAAWSSLSPGPALSRPRAVTPIGLCRHLLGPSVHCTPRPSVISEMRRVLATESGRGLFLLSSPPALTDLACSLLLWGSHCFGGDLPFKEEEAVLPRVSEEPRGLHYCPLSWEELGAPASTYPVRVPSAHLPVP